jgi:hypothetical protein
MKRTLVVVLALLCLASLAFAEGQKDKGVKTAGGVRTVAARADANPGESITPKDFPSDVMPGLKEIGAVPKKKYKDRLGMELIAANAGNNTTKQLQDVRDK